MPSQTLDSSKVSVSKLCCPVCWELFHILNMENAVCGCHPTVTPIVLPETLPEHVSEKMISHLRALLSGQLRHLLFPNIIPVGAGHHRNSSESAYSSTSSNENAAEYSDEFQTWSSVAQV
jgi:hypothetical protein